MRSYSILAIAATFCLKFFWGHIEQPYRYGNTKIFLDFESDVVKTFYTDIFQISKFLTVFLFEI